MKNILNEVIARFLLLARMTVLVSLKVYITCITVYLLLRLLLGDSRWWLAFLNAFSAYLFIPIPIILPLVLMTRKRWLIVATAAIAIIGLVWIGPDFLPKPVHTASARTLKIVTFNVFGGSNSHWTEIEAWLRQTNADIVVFQESPTQYREHGVTALKSLYPYQFAQPTIDGSMILSRFPFLSTENSVAGPDNGSVQTRVTLDFDGQIIAVYNIHLFIPLRGNPRLTLSRSQSPLITMALSYDDGFRNAQIKGVLDKLDKEQLPFIAAGDFNTSDQSVIYRTLADHMGDTFREVGIGLGGSWPVSRGEFPLFLPPLIRIDYIWHSKQFDAVDAQQGPKLGSDHLPLIGSLELRPAP